MKLAAGLATGYVLGARAGRDKYERIAAAVRTVSAGPGASAETDHQTAPEPETSAAAPPAPVATTEQPTAAAASAKPRRPRNRRPKAAAQTPTAGSTDKTQTMSTAKLDLDDIPMEAAEADVIEQRMPVADRSDDTAPTSPMLESDPTDAREQRRSL
jgi:hypothetical protein